MEAKAEETQAEETKQEYLRMQYVVDVELKKPMQHGQRKISHLEITMNSHDSDDLTDGVLTVRTDVEGRVERFPESNVVKWRVDAYEVPIFPKGLVAYEYDPYTYPEQVGGYLGSYSNDDGCIGFLDMQLQITTMEDLEA